MLPESTREMLGWRDTDSDGIIDIFDVPLELDGFGGHIDFAGLADGMAYEFDGQTQPGLLPPAGPTAMTVGSPST